MTTTPDRSAALAAMARSTAADRATGAVLPASTGVEYGDGDVTRLVTSSRFPFLDKDGNYQLANRGDTVHVSAEQAERGEKLGALADVDNPPTTVPDPNADDLTDEQLSTMGAPELVAWVNGHPDQRDRVRRLEEARPRKAQRITVLRTVEQLDTAYTAQDDAEAAKADQPYDKWSDEALLAEVRSRNEGRPDEAQLTIESREQIAEDLELDDEAYPNGYEAGQQ